MSLMVINPFVFTAAGLTTITQVLSATSAGSTINFPGGILAGDMIVLLDAAIQSGGSPAAVTPSGFTVISNQLASASNALRTIVSYKLAVGTETGALTGMNGSAQNSKLMYVFRGDIAATSLTLAGLTQQTTDANPTAQVVTASGGVAPLVVFGCYSCGDPISPRTMTPAKDGELASASSDAYLAFKIYNSSPADVTVDMDDEVSRNTLSSFYIQMA